MNDTLQVLNNARPKLDEWDCKMIHLFKSTNSENHITIEKVKQIWADRCGMGIEFMDLALINAHFLELANDLGIFAKSSYKFVEFIYSLRPEENWKYTCIANRFLKKETTDFNLILLSRLDSLFSHTLVVDLPGYAEYIRGQKNIDGARY